MEISPFPKNASKKALPTSPLRQSVWAAAPCTVLILITANSAKILGALNNVLRTSTCLASRELGEQVRVCARAPKPDFVFSF